MSNISEIIVRFFKFFEGMGLKATKDQLRVPTPPIVNYQKGRPESDSKEFPNDDSKSFMKFFKQRGNRSDLEEYQLWLTCNDINLTIADKNDILDNRCISDSVVNAAQSLLRCQYPDIKGLQNVLLYEIERKKVNDWCIENQNKIKELKDKRNHVFIKMKRMEMSRQNVWNQLVLDKYTRDMKKCEHKIKQINAELAKQKKKRPERNDFEVEGLEQFESDSRFVQIFLNRTSTGNHWICVSNLRTNDSKIVRIYDSDLKQIEGSIDNYSVHLKRTLIRLFIDNNNCCLELPMVSQCSDQSSGAVYAIAFARALCQGLDPSDILFSTDVKDMRSHLNLFLENGLIEDFPKGSKSPLKSFVVIRESKKEEN